MASGETVDAVHEVVDVGQQRDVHEREWQQLRVLDAREGENGCAEHMRGQARRGGQRPQVIHERHRRDQQRPDEPADCARAEAAAGCEPAEQADEETTHDHQAAAAWRRTRVRAARVGDVQRPPRRPAQISPAARQRRDEGENKRRRHQAKPSRWGVSPNCDAAMTLLSAYVTLLLMFVMSR